MITTFKQWANDYATRFPNVGRILAESESFRGDWEDVLSKFSIETLLEATRWVALLDPQPFPGDHFPKLVARCKSMTMLPRMHQAPYDPTKEQRFKCLDCRDSGSIEVYHPMAYKPIKDGEFSVSKHLRTCLVACTCDSGTVMATERRYKSGSTDRIVKGYPRFDPRKMQPMQATRIEEQVVELTHFVLNEFQETKFGGFEDYQ
jgi:hypothetical protein